MDIPLLSHLEWEAPRRPQPLCAHFPPHSTPGQTAELPQHARCNAFMDCMLDIHVPLIVELSRVGILPTASYLHAGIVHTTASKGRQQSVRKMHTAQEPNRWTSDSRAICVLWPSRAVTTLS